MNQAVLERARSTSSRVSIVDCDVHITARSAADLYPWLSARWREHVEAIGPHVRGGLYNQEPHPRMMARGMRADAYPEEGGPPGCSLPLLQQQHLDPNGIEFGMLIALGRGIFEERNQHFARIIAISTKGRGPIFPEKPVFAWPSDNSSLQAAAPVNAT